MDHAGTHDPNNPAIGRILNPGNSRQVCPGIGTPVTQERNDQGFVFIAHASTSLSRFPFIRLINLPY
jgi:hypothetical protein